MRLTTGLKYQMWGDGEEALFLQPSLGLGRWLFHRAIPVFSRRFTVVAWDPRGVADNVGLGPIALEQWVEDAASLMAHLDKPAHLLGVSMGTWIASRAALAAPELVRSLVLIGATTGFPGASAALKARRRDLSGVDMAAFAEAYASSTLTPYAQGEIRENLVAEMAMNTADRYLAVMEAFYGVPNTEVFSRITCPTLVIAGSLDERTPPEAGELVARIIPNAWLTVLPRAGHLALLDQPERVHDAVLGFWQSISPQAWPEALSGPGALP